MRRGREVEYSFLRVSRAGRQSRVPGQEKKAAANAAAATERTAKNNKPSDLAGTPERVIGYVMRVDKKWLVLRLFGDRNSSGGGQFF